MDAVHGGGWSVRLDFQCRLLEHSAESACAASLNEEVRFVAGGHLDHAGFHDQLGDRIGVNRDGSCFRRAAGDLRDLCRDGDRSGFLRTEPETADFHDFRIGTAEDRAIGAFQTDTVIGHCVNAWSDHLSCRERHDGWFNDDFAVFTQFLDRFRIHAAHDCAHDGFLVAHGEDDVRGSRRFADQSVT